MRPEAWGTWVIAGVVVVIVLMWVLL